jgi:3-oxoacyl-[acyl-carrier-protein] synthase-3
MDLNLPLRIAGVGRYLPSRVVSNEYLEARCGLPRGWIEHRNGVRERRWVDGESASFMAAEASREALAEAGLRPGDLDLIINASATGEQALPEMGSLIQRQLGLGGSGIPAMTVQTACLSFMTALEVAANYLLSGRFGRILIASSDIASCGLDFNQPESATLMGDAAAAVVVVRSGEGESSRICSARFRTWGDGAYLTAIMGGGSARHPRRQGHDPADDLFHMDGPAVLRMVRRHDAGFLEELRPGLSTGLGDIDLVVPHQASKVGLQLLRRFGWPEHAIVETIGKLGNCVAASLPSTLYQSVRDGRARRGDRLLLVGTGAGLSIGGLVLVY